jgi:hypothetical protein
MRQGQPGEPSTSCPGAAAAARSPTAQNQRTCHVATCRFRAIACNLGRKADKPSRPCRGMTNFYLDIETTGIDAEQDQILTIQFQPLDRATGMPIGDLRILKAWESSEKQILETFINECRALDPYPFAFIPVGFNLMFEHNFLRARSVANGLPEIDILSRPFIDLKAVGVLMRNGEFKGTSLDALTGKQGNGSQIAAWCAAGDFGSIVGYIEQEAREFIRFHVWLCEKMPGLWSEWMKECSSHKGYHVEGSIPATPSGRWGHKAIQQFGNAPRESNRPLISTLIDHTPRR